MIALLLSSIACISKTKDNSFDTALRYTHEVNDLTRSFGEKLWDNFKGKETLGIPVADFTAKVKELFGDVKLTENPLVYDFDLNKNGFIDREEAGLAFRNVFISISRDVAFNGLKFSAPKGSSKRSIDSYIFNISKKYENVKNLVNHLFDLADKNKNGLLSTGKFLETFTFKPTENLHNIVNTVNPTGEEKINKDQAFYLFALLVLDSEVKQEGNGIRVAGAEREEGDDKGKHFLQKKF